MNQDFVIFVCEHGAAKSILATAYFNELAKQNGLTLRAIARGTNPDHQISSNALEGLHRDGLTLPNTVPQKLTFSDVESAQRIISFCELPKEYLGKANYENWSDVPAVSEDYEKARDRILAKLQALMNEFI